MEIAQHRSSLVDIRKLKPHPRNYRVHPDDQLDHLAQSLREHGVYRNVVTSRDFTILAGHGVVQAAERAEVEKLPVIKLDLDENDPKALKILTGDNELANLAEVNDRVLTELLREIGDTDVDGLLGTGFNKESLAALLFITRPASEILSMNEAALWAGMPDYDNDKEPKLVITFDDEAERQNFVDTVVGGASMAYKLRGTWSMRWPLRDRGDPGSVKFDV